MTWNVAGRVRGVPGQLAALAERPADVVALQEIRLSSLGAWREGLAGLGFAHVASSLDGFDPGARLAPDRRLGVLVATRSPVDVLPAPDGMPWAERVLCAAVTLPGAGAVELMNLHAPLSNKADEVKVRTLEAAFAGLAPPSATPRILVGDLNTPQYESREGEVSTFARTRSGRLRPEYGERHDRAEMALITGLAAHGYEDAFRTLHGYARRDRSWLYPNGKMGWRLDHIIVRGLRVDACEYIHAWRERRLSDHSAMWASVG